MNGIRVMICAAMLGCCSAAGAQAPTPEKLTASRLDILDLRNMDVNDVLKLIAQKSGLNVAVGKNVSGRVTVFLKDVDVYEALRIICETNDWAYQLENNIIQVMAGQEYEAKFGQSFGQDEKTRSIVLRYAQSKDVTGVLSQIKTPKGKIISDEKSNTLILIDRPAKIEEMQKLIADLDAPVETQVLELVHAKAADVIVQVQEFLTPGLGKAKFDERSNKLIITDTPAKLTDINWIIEEIDHRDPEVLIEAKIIQIVLNDQHKTGVDWQALFQDVHALTFTGHFDLLGTTDKRGEISVGTVADDQYSFLFQALETVGRTNILSSPRITALNNKEAKMLVGSTEPYVTSTITTPSAGPTTTAETVNFIDVGVKLYVTPRIHNDGFITMEIRPEVSSVVSLLTTSTNNTIPVVETSEAETTVMVKDGVTIVIGGLMKEEKIATTKRIPLLGKIPVLGYPFRSHDDRISNTEIAILLTPHIVSGDENAASKYDRE